ncbi:MULTISPECIES: hypothetical protein [unclassified Streptococcus]|uniref:hypothetical protein n=1 Tax=unclassified Streptococcus TaxID=2608887 RepID=UPI0010721886|nr:MULTISPECIES: hypothetical protein [unclassified Streptococcus]MBF0788162.1 hypothetical protein [Streptococcus sp. 19428wC2_LYSM12]MCQ9212285.1 hypothetical protein [Streptococcus sp. B01]MCQ9213616.1 hypothetical protein [Streptococcus sp. O1]TFV04763.1 hypothetical protein E4T79_09765 [Streptococcus sp. LYSM12]
MAESLNIDVKRTGFPVTIGGVELWFDTSNERLAEFFDMEAESERKLTEFQKEVVQSNIGKDIEENSITKDTVLGAVELEKKLLKIQYDLLFGDSTFAKLYEEFPDYQALENTFEQVCALIEEKLKELQIEREAVVKDRIAKYTKKGICKKK